MPLRSFHGTDGATVGYPMDPVDTPKLDPRRLGAAFLAAFAFSALVCGSVIAQRMARGDSPVGWLFGVGITVAAAFLVHFTRRALDASSLRSVLAANVLGLAAAMALVHLGALTAFAGDGLIERPAQLANDGVLDVALLGLAWSYVARSPRARALLPVPSFLLVGGYLLTRGAWHVDPFHGFGVQSYVVTQVLATAGGLLAYYLLHPNAWGHR
jgi:hypothetical protein